MHRFTPEPRPPALPISIAVQGTSHTYGSTIREALTMFRSSPVRPWHEAQVAGHQLDNLARRQQSIVVGVGKNSVQAALGANCPSPESGVVSLPLRRVSSVFSRERSEAERLCALLANDKGLSRPINRYR